MTEDEINKLIERFGSYDDDGKLVGFEFRASEVTSDEIRAINVLSGLMGGDLT